MTEERNEHLLAVERLTATQGDHVADLERLRDELHARGGHANGQSTEEMPVVDGNGSLPAPRQPVAVAAPARPREATALAVRHEIPLTVAGHRHRVSAQPRRRPVRLRSESRW